MENNYFLNVGIAIPKIKLTDVDYNTKLIMELCEKAIKEDDDLIVFPDLTITGATCGDLYGQSQLLNAAQEALYKLLSSSYSIPIFVGLPLKMGKHIYKCTVIISEDKIIGVVPSNNLSKNERRIFSEYDGEDIAITLGEYETAFGHNIRIEINGAIVCVADKTYESAKNAASIGADIVVFTGNTPIYGNSFSDMTTKVNAYSKEFGYAAICPNNGLGESTTDFILTGKSVVCEDGEITFVVPDFDSGLFSTSIELQGNHLNSMIGPTTYEACLDSVETSHPDKLYKIINPYPFVKTNFDVIDAENIICQQAYALAARVEHVGSEKIVLGLSGGLDSAWALIVAASAMNVLGRPYDDILCVSMPCFGTSDRTKNNAELLANTMGCSFKEIDISESVKQHLRDIGHNINDHNITYENAQARERTQLLMDLANDVHGFVLGTGDLSEIALGWCTYNGDHMSMYGVNASIPKTLLRKLMVVYAEEMCGNSALSDILMDIVDTPVSPELLPPKCGKITQKTEEKIGPYELNDFFLYHMVKNHASKDKILYLASHAKFSQNYTEDELQDHLDNFYKRFINAQFKRSCSPDGPQVTEVSLSPRGGFMMPSDTSIDTWTEYLI